MDNIESVELLDAKGNVVASLGARCPQPDVAPNADGELPTNLDWHREAAKWLMTTSGAAVVFSYGFTTDASLAARAPILASDGPLLLSIWFGIRCYLWILSYANSVELLGHSGLGAQDKQRIEEKRKHAGRRITPSFKEMIYAFFAGILILVLLGAMRVLFPVTAAVAPTQAVAAGGDPDVAAVLFDPRNERVDLLTRQQGGGYRWVTAPTRPLGAAAQVPVVVSPAPCEQACHP